MAANPIYKRGMRLLLLFFYCIIFSINTKAQIVDSLIVLSPSGMLDSVSDQYGNKYMLLNLAVNDTVRSYNDSLVPNVVSTCSSGYFQLYMEPGCGIEDTSISETERRNVVCQVLNDLSAFISSPLTTNGQKIKIWVRKLSNINTPASTHLWASSFYQVPSDALLNGIADNTIWSTLISGTDAYSGSMNPYNSAGASFFHGMMAINFDSVDWHAELDTVTDSAKYDLYTAVLRGMVRSLGFASLIAGDGSSLLGNERPYYSRYDLYLTDSGGAALINHSGSCNMYGYSFNGSLSASSLLSPNPSLCNPGDRSECGTAVKYDDGSMVQKVYTPNCYLAGYSLSYFEDMCMSPPDSTNNNLYFVMSNEQEAGPAGMKRYLKPEEKQVLCDIGYATATVYGDSSYLNYYDYGSTECPGISVAGVNDGIDSSGLYTYHGYTGDTMHISDILANDRNAASFVCLEIIAGSGTISNTTSTSFDYVPASGGVHVLRYVPVDASGTQGNITYIYAMATAASCNTVCNMVPNGDFESSSGCYAVDFPGNSSIDCWNRWVNTPDLNTRNCNIVPGWGVPSTYSNPATDIHPNSLIPNDHFVDLTVGWDSPSGDNYDEALQTTTTSPLVNGTDYVLDFWGKAAGTGIANNYPLYNTIFFGVSSAPLPPILAFNAIAPAPTYLLPATVSVFSSPVNLTTDWIHYVIPFTYSGPSGYNNFVVSSASTYYNHNASPPGNYIVYLDDVKLLPAANVLTVTPDTIWCHGGAYEPMQLEANMGGPGPISYSWTPSTSLSCSNCANPTAEPAATTTYTVTATDANGCSRTETVKVVVPDGCILCGADHAYRVLGGHGTINQNVGWYSPQSYWYIDNDVSVSGAVNGVVTLQNAVVKVKEGVTISVEAGTKMEINASHLFSCESVMWQGINLLNDGVNTQARLVVQGNSMIEDAHVAINAENALVPQYEAFICHLNGAIFNRNGTSLKIKNFTPDVSDYHFHVENTIFTSRDFENYGIYPYEWPPSQQTPANTPVGLKDHWTDPDPYKTPIRISNPDYIATGVGLTGVTCKDGQTPFAGIWLDHVGLTTATVSGNDYKEITIGVPATPSQSDKTYILYDKLNNGVYAESSNFKLLNSSYSHLYGAGVYGNAAPGQQYRMLVQAGASGEGNHKYYDCRTAIESHNYYDAVCKGNWIISSHEAPSAGTWGYDFSSWKYNKVDLSGNILTNIRYGISFAAATYQNQEVDGYLFINKNTVRAGLPSLTLTGSQSMYTGISVQNTVSCLSCTVNGAVLVDTNKILDPYFTGIEVNGFSRQNSTIRYDSVRMRSPLAAGTQYGIKQTNCIRNIVYNNMVIGSGQSNPNTWGLYMGGNKDQSVYCNTSYQHRTGFELNGAEPGTLWRHNKMIYNNYGMVLTGGSIGQQGAPGTYSDNEWLATGWSTYWQTFTYNNPTLSQSKLYVENVAVTKNPTHNSALPPLPANIYSVGNGLVTTTSTEAYICTGIPTRLLPVRFAAVAQNEEGYVAEAPMRSWMAQYGLWWCLQNDSTLTDSLDVLDSFKHMAGGSRYDWLAQVEEALAREDYDSARALLADSSHFGPVTDTDSVTGAYVVDDSYGDDVVANYLAFYDLYLKYQDSSMTGSDSSALEALAELCPVRDGDVVYQARALRSLVFHDLYVYNDSCSRDTVYPRPGHDEGNNYPIVGPTLPGSVAGGQAYSLRPNPSNGHISLLQAMADAEPVQIDILNMLGQTVYKEQTTFSNREKRLLLNTIAGNYLLRILDSSGRQFMLKFTVR